MMLLDCILCLTLNLSPFGLAAGAGSTDGFTGMAGPPIWQAEASTWHEAKLAAENRVVYLCAIITENAMLIATIINLCTKELFVNFFKSYKFIISATANHRIRRFHTISDSLVSSTQRSCHILPGQPRSSMTETQL